MHFGYFIIIIQWLYSKRGGGGVSCVLLNGINGIILNLKQYPFIIRHVEGSSTLVHNIIFFFVLSIVLAPISFVTGAEEVSH